METLTRKELAKLLKVTTRTVDRKRKELPRPINKTGHPRWSREAIQRWLNGGNK